MLTEYGATIMQTETGRRYRYTLDQYGLATINRLSDGVEVAVLQGQEAYELGDQLVAAFETMHDDPRVLVDLLLDAYDYN